MGKVFNMSRSIRLLVVGIIAAVGLVIPATVATAAAPPQITTASLPSVIQGAKYPTTTLKVTGGTWPYKWSVVGGQLPYGLKLSSGGQLSGATANALYSPHNITVQVKDAKGVTAVRDFQIVVHWWDIITPSLPTAKKGQFYYSQLKINGACLAYPAEHIYSQALSWSVITNTTNPGTLPAGLKISSSGVISGIPKAVGTSTFLVHAECALFNNGADAKTFTLTVS